MNDAALIQQSPQFIFLVLFFLDGTKVDPFSETDFHSLFLLSDYSKRQPGVLAKVVCQIPTIQEQKHVPYWGELCWYLKHLIIPQIKYNTIKLRLMLSIKSILSYYDINRSLYSTIGRANASIQQKRESFQSQRHCCEYSTESINI